MLYPEHAGIDCGVCREWVTRDGVPMEWAGEFIPRAGLPPPCEADPAGPCPLKDLCLERFTEAAEEIYQRFQEGRAVGFQAADMADDVFRGACAVIAAAEREAERVLLAWTLFGKPDGNG